MFRQIVLASVLLVCVSGAALAQSSEDADITTVPLVVERGVPLQVLLTGKVNFKQNASVHAKVVEPVYSFDREVIPAGTEIEGTVIGFEKVGKWTRISSMLGGDFTPLREPQISFTTLILADGERIPIDAAVVSGNDSVVRSDGSHGSGLKSSLTSTVKKPGKDQLKNWAWSLSPFHPQYIAAGVRLNAVLQTPLDFGDTSIKKEDLDEIGSAPPADGVLAVRLVTSLDSRTAKVGTAVQALLTRPVFSQDHKLLFPVGSVVQGRVTDSKPAAAFHRNGQLSFVLASIAPPTSWISINSTSRDIEASLASIRVTSDMKDLKISDGNTTRIVESKKRFLAPAWSFFKAERSINASADPFGSALLGAYRGKLLKQVTGSGPSQFGLPASISGAMIPPVGIGLGFYGAARAAYSSFLGRGRDINLPDNTIMEIRLEKRSPATTDASDKLPN